MIRTSDEGTSYCPLCEAAAKERDFYKAQCENVKRCLTSTQIMLKHYEPQLRGPGADNLRWQIEQNDEALSAYHRAQEERK